MALAETCAELAYYGPFESGEYEIDPDGYGVRRNGPIRVFCDFTTNSTVIRHNLGNEVSLENHFLQRGPQGAVVDISYDAPMDQIKSLLYDPLARCKQEIVFSCKAAPLVIDNNPLASFRSSDSSDYREFPSYNFVSADTTTCCNCNSSSPELLQDRIVITAANRLPVTGFTYGPFKTQNAQASVQIKSLECEHEHKITRNDCNSIKFLTSNRLQFDMEYAEYLYEKDCFVEVYLLQKADLKLTVSNFKVRQIY